MNPSTTRGDAPAKLTVRVAALPRPAARVGLPWLIAAVLVLAVWLLGSLVDRSGIAYGQTVPGAPVAVSVSAATVAKRRPQLAADPVTGGVYMVWEEGATGSANGSNLYFAFRDPGTGTWSAPSLVIQPAFTYAARFGGLGVNETHAHVQVDPAGNLHVVYAVERTGGIGGRGAYYTVGTGTTAPGTASWTDPVRLDMVTYAPASNGYLYFSDNTRLFVRTDPAGAYTAVGYVLWTGNNGNQLRMTRVGYGPAHAPVTPLDAAPLSNPITTNVGPVAVLEIDANTLQLVYAGSSLQTGNGFWAAPLALNGGGAPSWGTRANVAGVNGNSCNIESCQGATAVRDDSGNVWVAANYDSGSAHNIQVTAHDAVPLNNTNVTMTIIVDHPIPRAGRQPVIAFEQNAPTTTIVLLYNQCTYSTASSCPGKDMYYRALTGGAAGDWSPAYATGSTTGEQQDLTAVLVGDDLYYAWVGVNQSGTGQQAYFHWVYAP